MADNVAITAGTGTTIAADDIGGVLHQRVKLSVGADGTAADFDAAIKAASTAPVAADKALVVAISPNSVNANGQVTMANSAPVVIASDQTAVPTNPQPGTTGGLSVFRSLDLDETEEDVKTSAGCLYKLRLTNRAATARYVKLYNATAANVTVGTTTPIDTIVVPGASSADLATVITESFGGMGLAFGTALSLAATTGFADNDTGAPATNDVIATAYYK